MRISDWSTDLCSSYLRLKVFYVRIVAGEREVHLPVERLSLDASLVRAVDLLLIDVAYVYAGAEHLVEQAIHDCLCPAAVEAARFETDPPVGVNFDIRSEEHTSELQSLMRISYAVFCLKKKIKTLILINK